MKNVKTFDLHLTEEMTLFIINYAFYQKHDHVW